MPQVKASNQNERQILPEYFGYIKGKTISAPTKAILVTPERMAANVNVFDEKTRNSKMDARCAIVAKQKRR